MVQPNVVQPNVVQIGKAPQDSDEFEVNDAGIENDTLIVNLSYGGGCRDHVFTAYADGKVDMSDPVAVELVISIKHDANGDPCEAWLTNDVRFDLTPIRKIHASPIRLILVPPPPGADDLTYDDLVYEF